jgi:hypothetical protein
MSRLISVIVMTDYVSKNSLVRTSQSLRLPSALADTSWFSFISLQLQS